MANFNYPMSLENPYTFVDPFQPSINFSLQNLIIRRRKEEATIDDVPLPPPNNLFQRHTEVPTYTPRSGRQPSPSSYSSVAPSRISFKQSRSPIANSNRNTFGMEATTSARHDRSHSRGDRISSPKPRGSMSSFLPPQSDRESRAGRNSPLHQTASIGGSTSHDVHFPHLSVSPIPASDSGHSQPNHRRWNLPSDQKSRAEAKNSNPEIILEDRDRRHSAAQASSSAIPYYKPPTRSSEVALPSTSPHLADYLPGIVHDSAIKHEIPSPSAYPASQPPPQLVYPRHQPPNLAIYILAFLFDTLPRQIYLNFMLRLPHLYFTHVIRIFEDAEMSMPEIKQMALEANNYLKDPTISKALHLGSSFASPRYNNLSSSWGAFIDSLMRDWKMMNIISVLLLSATLTILQIQSAVNDPVTRYAALLSMICAFMSLLYGCIYIIRFGIMRSTCKAAEWAHEAQKTTTDIFWNVWVLLAMPAIWLAWSMIFLIISIMTFIWRTGTIEDTRQTPIVTSHEALAPRIVVTCVFSLGLIYLVLIHSTFRRYGTAMDRSWRTRVLAWMHGNFNNSGCVRFSMRRELQGSVPLSPLISPQPPIQHHPSQHLRNGPSPTPPAVVSPSSQVDVRKERSRGRSTSIKPISTFIASASISGAGSQVNKNTKPTYG